MKKYKIEFRNGSWMILDREARCYLDRFDSLPEAHDWATACAITDECFAPGGLTKFFDLKSVAGMRWLDVMGYRW